jgi:hypothetical protein
MYWWCDIMKKGSSIEDKELALNIDVAICNWLYDLGFGGLSPNL